jgi:predicted alpha/beta hydrolase
MRNYMIALTATAAFTLAAGAAYALPGALTGSAIRPAETGVVQIHTGRFACHLTRRGWKRDTRPISKSCPRHHRYRCWGTRNCWYKL